MKKRQTTLFNFINKDGTAKKKVEESQGDIEDHSVETKSQAKVSNDEQLEASSQLPVKRCIDESDTENEPSRKKGLLDFNNAEQTSHTAQNRISVKILQGAWKKGEAVPYSALCDTFDLISATTKRLEIAAILTKFFRSVITLSPESLLECIYLCLNKIAPEYEGKEMGLGESLLVKAIAKATGREASKIKADFVSEGDLGIVAQNSKRNQMTLGRTTPLTVSKVFKSFKEITLMAGNNSQGKKIDKIQTLLVSSSKAETKYLVRSLEGKLRIGLAEKTVIIALGHAAALSEYGKVSLEEQDKASDIIKRVYWQCPNYDLIVPALLSNGIKALPEHCKLTPGIPLQPMLAKPTKSITEVLDRFENATFSCEYKYDGERAQVHQTTDKKISIFSRNGETLSAKYPDLMALMPQVVGDGVTSFVMDCEAVAWDAKKACILPFQILSTRKRKDVAVEDISVQVCLFAFDLLYLNGEPLITSTLRKRRSLLHSHFKEREGQFAFAKGIDAQSIEAIQSFLDESIVQNCEGLMVKTLDTDSSYEPSVRSRNWLKVKKDYIEGVGDSLDLVVIGGYYGKGKRTGWYGGFLLACYDEDSETYQSICKIATGFSEEDLKAHHELLSKNALDTPPSYYSFGENVRPDVWFGPSQVWEVKAADLSISPVHQAAYGLVDHAKGISLRFPRFIRIREDKNPEQATSSEQVADMYRAQKINKVDNEED